MKKYFFQNVSLMILNNFYYDQTLLKFKSRWNKRLSQTITEKWQNDGCMTSYVKIGTWYKKENLFKMFLWSCYMIKHCLKSKSRWRNRRLSQTITKNGKMTAVWRHTSKSGHDVKKKTFSKYFSDHTEQLLPWSTLLKNQVSA